MQIYRPFKSIKKSVKCLHQRELYISGLIDCPILISNILDSLEDSPKLNTPVFNYYFNNGNPYLYDLVIYYQCAQKYNLKWEGIPFPKIESLLELDKFQRKTLKSFSNRSPWKDYNARFHRVILLHKNKFWYKRYFMSYSKLNLEPHLSFKMFNENEPNKIFYKDLFGDKL